MNPDFSGGISAPQPTAWALDRRRRHCLGWLSLVHVNRGQSVRLRSNNEASSCRTSLGYLSYFTAHRLIVFTGRLLYNSPCQSRPRDCLYRVILLYPDWRRQPTMDRIKEVSNQSACHVNFYLPSPWVKGSARLALAKHAHSKPHAILPVAYKNQTLNLPSTTLDRQDVLPTTATTYSHGFIR